MKVKRIFALVLALTLIFAFMAMAVSARATCPKCGSGDAITTTTKVTISATNPVQGCSKNTSAHNHVTRQHDVMVVCRTCGVTSVGHTYYTTTCE